MVESSACIKVPAIEHIITTRSASGLSYEAAEPTA
jgi:hypothetical protein